MKTTHSRFATVALSVLSMLYVVGCENSSQVPNKLHTYDINAYPLDKVVCEPMGGGGGSSPKHGIKAELFYRSQGQPVYYTAQDYADHATKAEQNLFFSDMFVPTRMFDVGFTTQTNGVLKNDNNETLIEYFGLKMNTVLQLRPEDEEGVYEFALLSDDGSVMKVGQQGAMQTIINNDGDHPTRLGCSTVSIPLQRNTKLQTEVLYYQGPRYHIANVLLWRKMGATDPVNQDVGCGATGNSTWFDPNNNSQPTVNFTNLLSRGWKVVDKENFYVPEDGTETTQYNPCTLGTVPIISELQITELVSTDIWVGWRTDIPATAQLMINNLDTGESIITQTDNIVRTRHNYHYSGLTPNTRYELRVINVSEDLGKAIGGPLQFNTP